MIPGVIYGHKQETASVAVPAKALLDGLHAGNRLFELDLAGNKEVVLIKDLQYDHYGAEVLHVDFIRVNLDEKAQVTVPLVLKGEAPGAAKGGVVEEQLDHVEIVCGVVSIPESISVSIKKLEFGGSIYAKDVKLPAGAELVTDPEAVIVHCVAKKKAVEATEESEATEE